MTRTLEPAQWLWALFLAGLLAGNSQTSASEAPGFLRIASFNIYNHALMDRRLEGRWLPAYPKPESERAALRRLIRSIGADIICLQEMGNEPQLWLLQSELARMGSPYPYSAWTQGEDTVRHVAFLSRHPIVLIEQGVGIDFPYRGSRIGLRRGLLGIQVETQAGPLSLYGVHLKSKWTEFADDPQAALKRLGEAEAIRNHIHQRYPEDDRALFLVLGDFNDTRDSRPLRRFFRRGARELLRALDLADSRGDRWTHHWARQDVYSRIDYILVSEELHAFWRPETSGITPPRESVQASDHRLIWADFVFSAQPSN